HPHGVLAAGNVLLQHQILTIWIRHLIVPLQQFALIAGDHHSPSRAAGNGNSVACLQHDGKSGSPAEGSDVIMAAWKRGLRRGGPNAGRLPELRCRECSDHRQIHSACGLVGAKPLHRLRRFSAESAATDFSGTLTISPRVIVKAASKSSKWFRMKSRSCSWAV